ncbi:MAG: hypothetical protein IT384_21085 [Deltaproteobacteria bacterium]|nr:hypothetical protein [Deltaproteobacteria bacterium]
MSPSRPDVLRLVAGICAVMAACETPADPADAGRAGDASLPGDTGLDASAGDASLPPVTAPATLFIGNSYVYTNDVAGRYRALLEALAGASARVEQVAPGGYRLEQHALDARTDGTPLARWLRTGTPEETAFDRVILQEQSQLGGIRTGPQREASVAAATELARLADAHGATIVLYVTWGREHGDPANVDFGFGTYEGMQDQLDAAYLELAELLRAQGMTVRVAPVGAGFRNVYLDVQRSGADPLAEGSDFDALYEADGSHPSLRGAYLAACVLAGTATTVDARGFADEPALGSSVSVALRDACTRALSDPRW